MIEQADLSSLRSWIVSKVTNLSDADPDVLADFILALLKHELPDDELFLMCQEQLRDFLQDNTAQVVRELIYAVNTRSYKSGEEVSVDQHINSLSFALQSHSYNHNQNNSNNNTTDPSASFDAFLDAKRHHKGPHDYNGNISNIGPQKGGFNGSFNDNASRFDRSSSTPHFQKKELRQLNTLDESLNNHQSFHTYNDNNNRNGNRYQRNSHRNKNTNGYSERESSKKREYHNDITLVVENIPEDKLNENELHGYFEQFGTLTSINITHDLKLAEITFENHSQAKNAWNSPDPIFNNRFIRVYWKKFDPFTARRHQKTRDEAEAKFLNIEKAIRIQDEKQKVFEEKLKKKQETEEKRQELQKLKSSVLIKHQEQQKFLEAKIENEKLLADGDLEKLAKINVLEQQLKKLKEEGASLAASISTPNHGNSNIRVRGRAMYNTRSYGYNPYGGRGGREGFKAALSTYNLDLRPKKVVISPISEEQEEFLRGVLISFGEYQGLDRNPAIPNQVVVSFKDRQTAEKFYNRDIKGLGIVEKSWYAESSGISTTFDEDVIIN